MQSLNFCREFLDSHPPRSIIFQSDNQDDYEQDDTTSLQLSFSNVMIGERPNVIRMYDESNSMTLYDIKGVEIDEETAIIGAILRVICGSAGRDHRYTFILQQ